MDMKRHKGFFMEHWHVIAVLLLLYDAVAVNMSYFLALWLRFDCRLSVIPMDYLRAWANFTLAYTLFCVLIFNELQLYKSVWRFASYTELLHVMVASLLTGIFHAAAITLLFRRIPNASERRLRYV